MQEGRCGGDTRYRTGNPTEALLGQQTLLEAEHRCPTRRVDRRQLRFISSKPLRQMQRWCAHARTIPRGVAIAKGGDARLAHGRHVGRHVQDEIRARAMFAPCSRTCRRVRASRGEYHHALCLIEGLFADSRHRYRSCSITLGENCMRLGNRKFSIAGLIVLMGTIALLASACGTTTSNGPTDKAKDQTLKIGWATGGGPDI